MVTKKGYKRTDADRAYHRDWTARRKKFNPAYADKLKATNRKSWARIRSNDPKAHAEKLKIGMARYREWHYRTSFGITLAQYDKMFEKQGGVCAICGKPPKTIRLAVDHDHRTGRVRGLLCSMPCNRRLLGRGLEDPEIHEKAAKYLRETFDGRKI